MRLLADIELFAQVAHSRSFVRAAAVLGMTRPTLSRRIGAIERELGVTLIRRSTRSFALTDAGRTLLVHAESILAAARRASDEIHADQKAFKGHLRVGLPVDLAITLLTPALSRLPKQNSDVSMTIIATKAQPDLESDSLDIAFAVNHRSSLKNSAFYTHPIGSFRRMLYLSEGYFEAHGEPREACELQQHEVIRVESEAGERTWQLSQSQKRQRWPVQGRCFSSSVMACAQLAREGLGIAILPDFIANHPSLGGGLRRVLPDCEAPKAYVLAITATRDVPARIRELIRLVREDFRSRALL